MQRGCVRRGSCVCDNGDDSNNDNSFSRAELGFRGGRCWNKDNCNKGEDDVNPIPWDCFSSEHIAAERLTRRFISRMGMRRMKAASMKKLMVEPCRLLGFGLCTKGATHVLMYSILPSIITLTVDRDMPGFMKAPLSCSVNGRKI